MNYIKVTYGVGNSFIKSTFEDNSTYVKILVNSTFIRVSYDGGDAGLDAERLRTRVYNVTGSTLVKGTVVYINGSHGNLPSVAKAIATADATSAQTMGLVLSDIEDNKSGYIILAGKLSDLDTQAIPNGSQLYLSSTVAGGYTTAKQYAPAHLVYVGIVNRSHPTQGEIEVKIQNGYEADEIHDFAVRNPSNNDGIFFNSATSLWEKKQISTALGYTPVPTSRTITINGVSYDLSADRSYTIAAGISGSGASGQVAFWNGASSLTGSANLTYSAGFLTNSTTSTDAGTFLLRPSNSYQSFIAMSSVGAYSNSNKLWSFGLAVGSQDFNIQNWNGSILSANIRISASTGNVLINPSINSDDGVNSLQVYGGVNFGGSSGFTWNNSTQVIKIGSQFPTNTATVNVVKSDLLVGYSVKNTSTGASYTQCGYYLENNGNHVAQLYKTGTGYVTYKNISANDLGFYNGISAGNISILNDNPTGNINFAAGGVSTAQMTLTNDGRLGVGTNTPNAGGILHIDKSQNTLTSLFVTNNNTGTAAHVGFRAGLDPTNFATDYISMFILGANWVTSGNLKAKTGVIENFGSNFVISNYNNTEPISFVTGTSRGEKLRLFNNGNVLIQNGGTFSDTGERLQVNGTLKVTSFATFGVAGNAFIFDGGGVRTDRTSFGVLRDGVNYNFFVSQLFGQNTSGTFNVITTPTNYQPTSGTAIYNTFVVNATVNQTGGANGITRGLYVAPTLTSAFDWRSIQWDNNSGWGLYGAGTASNYINGNLTIGSTSNPSGEKFVAWGNVRLGLVDSRVVFINGYNNYITANRLHLYDAVTNIRCINSGNQGMIVSKSTGLSDLYPSSIFAIDSTNQGFLPPRMTTTQKNAIATPTAGLVVYDTTLNKLCVYTTTWETITST